MQHDCSILAPSLAMAAQSVIQVSPQNAVLSFRPIKSAARAHAERGILTVGLTYGASPACGAISMPAACPARCMHRASWYWVPFHVPSVAVPSRCAVPCGWAIRARNRVCAGSRLLASSTTCSAEWLRQHERSACRCCVVTCCGAPVSYCPAHNIINDCLFLYAMNVFGAAC